jgi:hypothetical protein
MILYGGIVRDAKLIPFDEVAASFYIDKETFIAPFQDDTSLFNRTAEKLYVTYDSIDREELNMFFQTLSSEITHQQEKIVRYMVMFYSALLNERIKLSIEDIESSYLSNIESDNVVFQDGKIAIEIIKLTTTKPSNAQPRNFMGLKTRGKQILKSKVPTTQNFLDLQTPPEFTTLLIRRYFDSVYDDILKRMSFYKTLIDIINTNKYSRIYPIRFKEYLLSSNTNSLTPVNKLHPDTVRMILTPAANLFSTKTAIIDLALYFIDSNNVSIEDICDSISNAITDIKQEAYLLPAFKLLVKEIVLRFHLCYEDKCDRAFKVIHDNKTSIFTDGHWQRRDINIECTASLLKSIHNKVIDQKHAKVREVVTNILENPDVSKLRERIDKLKILGTNTDMLLKVINKDAELKTDILRRLDNLNEDNLNYLRKFIIDDLGELSLPYGSITLPDDDNEYYLSILNSV